MLNVSNYLFSILLVKTGIYLSNSEFVYCDIDVGSCVFWDKVNK